MAPCWRVQSLARYLAIKLMRLITIRNARNKDVERRRRGIKESRLMNFFFKFSCCASKITSNREFFLFSLQAPRLFNQGYLNLMRRSASNRFNRIKTQWSFISDSWNHGWFRFGYTELRWENWQHEMNSNAASRSSINWLMAVNRKQNRKQTS